jgi:hypothetical protein
MFWTVNDGKVVDPRDIEETPDMFDEGHPKAPETQGPQFFQVERQDQVRPCYLCARPSIEWANFGRYAMFLHQHCWWVMGGGWERDRDAKQAAERSKDLSRRGTQSSR